MMMIPTDVTALNIQAAASMAALFSALVAGGISTSALIKGNPQRSALLKG